MATTTSFVRSHRSVCGAVLSALASLVVLVAMSTARGESINASDFKIDIASNMAWIDNQTPAVGLKLWRQTAMEQAVLASRPYVRVTNLSGNGAIESFQLNLRNRDATAVTGVQWNPAQEGSKWRWNQATETARFDFDKPIDSGESFTVRIATGPQIGEELAYSLQQNFFAPGQPIFGELRSSGMSGFGILGLSVYDGRQAAAARSAVAAFSVNDIVAPVEQFVYPLDRVVVDPYKTFGQQVGITIQAVPEPSGLALLAAAATAGGVGLVRRRRAA